MKLVILESPFAPNLEHAWASRAYASDAEFEAAKAHELDYNVRYARAAMRDCLTNHGEAPSASHLLYTQEGVLDDTIPDERKLGIDAGLTWRAATEKSVVYLDRGLSGGMKYGIAKAKADGKEVVGRYLDPAVLQALGIPTVAVDPDLLAKLGVALEAASDEAAAA